ncbi:MAG: hypothetical protein ISR65_19785 [Bacteriovoracaceae bacterium]|nr:hypothetical protein [Bacteriovoracaceae bacterium]
MSKKILKRPTVYCSMEELSELGQKELFLRFHAQFKKYIEKRVDFANDFSLPAYDIDKQIDKSNFVKKTINYNGFIGFLEKAVSAAQSLVDQYDIGIGIAKQGLWLSFIFNLFKLETHDILVERLGMKRGRGSIPLDPLKSSDLSGKKIILLENDLVTGETVEHLTKGLDNKGLKHIDLLLIFRDNICSESYYKRVRKKIRGKAVKLGNTIEGEVVINTEKCVPSKIRKCMSLQYDFQIPKTIDSNYYLNELSRMLDQDEC